MFLNQPPRGPGTKGGPGRAAMTVYASPRTAARPGGATVTVVVTAAAAQATRVSWVTVPEPAGATVTVTDFMPHAESAVTCRVTELA